MRKYLQVNALCTRLHKSLEQAAILALMLAVFLTSAVKLHAQASTGITGTVTDASGAVVPNAKVTITNNATQVVNHSESNSAGTYNVPDLLPGTYTVQVESPGFQTSIHNGVLLEVGRNSTVDVALATGNVSTSVEVQESAITLNTTQPELGTTIENKVVEELPNIISGGRGRQIDAFVFLARSARELTVERISKTKWSSTEFRWRNRKRKASKPFGILRSSR